ncbi:DUF1189 family protein [Clostridium sp.]|uniref:DUF1189 family protein n=1 Tax=Clostridium sp. TaxID=1506 RepID=UPI0034649605
MNFFKRFGSSIYDFKSYNLLRKTSNGSTFLYLLVLILILSIGITIRPLMGIRNYNNVISQAIDDKIKTMELKDGTLVVNGGEEIVSYGEDKDTYFVVDTKGEVDKDKFIGKSGIILTKEGFQADFGSITNNTMATSKVDKSYASVGLGNMELDLIGHINNSSQILNRLFTIGVPISNLISNAVMALIYALVVGIMAGYRQLKLTFGERYKISIYAMTSIILIRTLLGLIGFGVHFMISFLVVCTYLFMATKAIKEEEVQDLNS